MKDVSYSENELVDMIAGEAGRREMAIRVLMKEEMQQQRITRHLLRLGATPEECEEIINDAFVALIHGITQSRFQSGSSIWGYLYGASKNLLWKMRRKEKLGTMMPMETAIEGPDESVEVRIIQGERRDKLLAIFRQLSEKCQKILHLAFYEEQKNEQIAEELGYKSKAVVGVKKSECLKGLAQLLENTPLESE